jgi:membrane-bound lytic murein transglycosylase B
MRRGLFLLILLSACAPTRVTHPPLETPSAPTATPQPAEPPVSTPEQPATPPPVRDMAFEAWKRDFIDKAVSRGLDRGFVERQLANTAPNPRILSRDTAQPEFSKPLSDYVRAAVTPDKVAEGQRRRQAGGAWMSTVENRYGVPPEVLIAIWAQESAFGRIQGDFDVVTAFVTLAHDGRRRAWAEDQLIAALKIIRDHGIPREKLKGSWAGAMGQTQFIPDSYLRLAKDQDGDGRADIWGSDQDALASAANLLATEGWRRGQSWAVEVSLPAGFDYSVAESEKHPQDWWGGKGVKRADGRSWRSEDAGVDAQLLLPAGAKGPAFLAYPNHFAIRKYNNSVSYALAVGLLADAIKGEPPLVTAWPREAPLSRAQRFNTQTALKTLGYPVGEVDGVIGSGTRASIRAWQKANGMLADGYLTPEVAERLRQSASLPAS